LLFGFDVTIGSQVEGVAVLFRMMPTSKYWYRREIERQKSDFFIVCNASSIPFSAQTVAYCNNIYSLGFFHPVYFTKHILFFNKIKLIHYTLEIYRVIKKSLWT
jgi:hypothetical protein